MAQSCLIVDDSTVIRRIVKEIMEGFGFACREAENGATAYDACVAEMPNLITLDWNMPVMNGLEFLQKLRATSGGQAPAVLFCTTEHEMSFIQRALEAGATDFIMKPFDQEIMRTKLVQNGLIEDQS